MSTFIIRHQIYVFILKHRERALVSDSEKLKKILIGQIEILKKGESIDERKMLFV